MSELLKELLTQEEELQFNSFTSHEDALQFRTYYYSSCQRRE